MLLLLLALFAPAPATAQPSPDVLRRVLHLHQAELDACLPSAEGAVRVSFVLTVLADGSVGASSVAVLEAPEARTAISACLQRVLSSLHLPEGVGTTEVRGTLERRGEHLALPPSRPLPPTSS